MHVASTSGGSDRLWPLLLVSLALHAGVLAVAAARRSPPIDLSQQPIVAKLVRLGEKRPEQWLPRRDVPAPEAAPAAPTAVPVPAPPAPPAKAVPSPTAQPKPAAPKPASAVPGKGTDALSRALDRVRRDKSLVPEKWGDPGGVADGEATGGTEGDRYLGLVTQALQSSYRLPATISEQERLYLRATVVLTIEPDGRVSAFRFEKKSGNAAFDAALERAVRDARLPPPPAEMRQRYRTTGLGVTFRV